jgi:hypothetical protein
VKEKKLLLIGIGLLASGALGCGFASSTGGEMGELGNGGFTYKCMGDGTDIACIDNVSLDVMVVAVGTPIALDYTPRPADSTKDPAADLTFLLKSASPEILTADGNAFQFVKAGAAALLARSPTGVVGDFLHLEGAEIDHFDAEDSLGLAVTAIQLAPLGSVVIDVAPKDAMTSKHPSGRKLAGPLHYAWKTSNATVAALTASSPVFGSARGNRITVTAGAQDGDATISVTVQERQDRQLDIPVQVRGAP